MRVLSGFSTRACFPGIGPATCANEVPLETVGDRSEPMGRGPNVDQSALLLSGGWDGSSAEGRLLLSVSMCLADKGRHADATVM
jgi:hypothetical protein